MGCNKNNAFFVTTVIFMIPLIVLSSLILSTKIKTENLEKIKDAPHNPSHCYNLTYSFEKRAKYRWKIYIIKYIFKIINTSLYSYYSILFYKNNFYTLFFWNYWTRYDWWSKWYVFMLYGCPSKNYIFYSNNSLCNIIKNQRIYNKLRSVHELLWTMFHILWDNFIDNFKGIMIINTLTLCAVILFVWEVVYHGIVFSVIVC